MGHRLDIVLEIRDASGDTKRINIELDGGHHETPYQKAKDKNRDEVLSASEKKYHVIRIPNQELSRPNMTADQKVGFIMGILTELLPELSSSEGASGGGRGAKSSHSAKGGRGTKGGRGKKGGHNAKDVRAARGGRGSDRKLRHP